MSQMDKLAKKYVQQNIELIKAKYGRTVRVDQIEWSNKMHRHWGLASSKAYNGQRLYIIKLAAKVFTEDSEAFRNTIAHEVAHLADFQIFKEWGHGRTWKAIMRAIGQNPTRCATEEEAKEIGYTYERKRQVRYVYNCSCEQVHYVSGVVHSRIQKGQTYKCRHCRTAISFTNQKKAA